MRWLVREGRPTAVAWAIAIAILFVLAGAVLANADSINLPTHPVPVVKIPGQLFVLSQGTLFWTWQDKAEITVDYGDGKPVTYLVTLQDGKQERFASQDGLPWWFWPALIGAAVVGAGVGHLLK